MGSRSFTDMALSFKDGSWHSISRAELRLNKSVTVWRRPERQGRVSMNQSSSACWPRPSDWRVRSQKGLEVIAEALLAAKSSGARGNDAELHRLRGNLLGRLPSPDRTEIEASCRLALAVAREQGTRGFELRAAVSLARLLCAQGRRNEARDLLAPVYDCFTQGFDAPDLEGAKTLLAGLG